MDARNSSDLSTALTSPNPVESPTESETEELIIITVVTSALVLVGVAGNILVIVTIFSSRRLRKVQHVFTASLAVCDLIFLSICMPFVIAAILVQGFPIGGAACNVIGFMSVVVLHASMISIVNIAINRYINIVHFTYYSRIYTRKNGAAILACVWLYSIILAIPSQTSVGRIYFMSSADMCMYDWRFNETYTAAIMIFGFLLPIVIAFICYLWIFLRVMNSRRKIRTRAASEKHFKREDLRLAINIFVVFLAFLVCWGPILLTVVFIDPHSLLPKYYYDIVCSMALLNSIINPPIYFFFNKVLRAESIALLRCRRPGHASTDSSESTQPNTTS